MLFKVSIMKTLSERLILFNRHLLPEMVQLKYQFMSETAFRFFRGTCHIFFEDLHHSVKLPAAPNGWICGDLHLENFGSFKGNNRMVYFDLNDFDEAMLAPVTWDAVRLVTSIFVAFDDLGIKTSEAKAAATLFLTVYKEVLSAGKALYIDPRTAEGIVKRFLKTVKKRKESDLIDRIRKKKSADLKINIDNIRFFAVDDKLKRALMKHITGWIKHTALWPKNYMVSDVAFRVAGTGSVGLKRYMFLLRSDKIKNRYALLDMKEGAASSLAPYNAVKQPGWDSEAERVVNVKQWMQNVSPALLSTTSFKDDNYVLQEMQPIADKLNLNTLIDDYDNTKQVIKDMALLLASSQLRSGGIHHSAIIDELVKFGHRLDWQEPVLTYARQYARQVIKDHKEFAADYKKGVFTLSPANNIEVIDSGSGK